MLNNLNLCNMMPGALYPYPLSMPMNLMTYGVENSCKYVLVDTDLIKESLNILKEHRIFSGSDLYDYFNINNRHKIRKEVLVIQITDSKLKLSVTNCFSLEEKFIIEMELERCLIEAIKEVFANILATIYPKGKKLDPQSKDFAKICELVSNVKLEPETAVVEEIEITNVGVIKINDKYYSELALNSWLYRKIAQELNYIHMNRNHNEYTKDVLLRGKNSMVQKIEEDKYKVITLNDEATVSTYTEALEYIIERNR